MKTLITASDIRQTGQEGKKSLDVVLANCIITPEAKVVAEQLGIKINEYLTQADMPSVTVSSSDCSCSQSCTPSSTKNSQLDHIRQQVMQQLKGSSVNETIVNQLVEKIYQEQQAKQQPAVVDENQPSFSIQRGKGGVMVVDGNSVKFGLFDGAPKQKIGITDVITAQDGSSMAAGFMQWDNAFFPWTLNYDEVDMVLEGELHIRHQGETIIGKAGDVMFIPKGSSIEFGTPSHVRFLYVACPANWQEL